jgi:hypothetical protein
VLLAAGALVGAMLAGVANPAAALAQDCESYHTNMEAYDATAERFGIGGEVYVNDSTTLGDLQQSVWRSIFVFHDNSDWTETGWADGPYSGVSSPTEYVTWDNDGTSSGTQFFNALDYDSDYFYKNQDQYGNEVYYFYVDGSELTYSPEMGFYKGDILTNSEHYDTCDSLWAHFYDLEYFNDDENWVSPLGDLEPYACDSDGNWLLNIVSDSELYVDQNDGVDCG